MPVDAETYRAALGRWATGVTIVTARDGERVHGMTASDFAGASLAPPMVLVCVDKQSNTLGVIEGGGNMAVNLLAVDQQALAARFASKRDEWARFEGLDCGVAATGAPLIPGALASLDCRVVARHDAGDHVLVLGRVEAVVSRDREPLLYFAGRYRGLAPPAGP